MSFAEALKKRLSSELYTQVMDSLGDDFNLDLVPRARLNAVINQRDQLREQVGTSAVKDDFTLGAVSQDPPPAAASHATSAAGTQPAKVPSVEEIRGELEKQFAAEKRDLTLRFVVLEKLRAAGAVDPELIYNAKLIDVSQVKDGKDGGFEGLDDMIKTLVEDTSKAYLFGVSAGTGRSGVPGTGGEVTAEAFKAMGYGDRLKLREEHPATYDKLVKTLTN